MRQAVATKQRDVARYSRCAGLAGLEVMSARWLRHSFAPHMHDFYAISLNERGHGAFDCRGEVHEAAPGTCNLIAPGEVHTGRATSGEGWEYRNLYVEPPLMAALLRSVGWRGSPEVGFRSALAPDPVLAHRLARVLASISEPSSLLQNQSLLLAVMARLVTGHLVHGHALPAAGREHAAIARAREWLDAHSEENVSIRSLAGLAGLSPWHFVRAFHRQVGVPPHRYQTTIRVNRARRLLAAGGEIADVAHRAGFCDQSHLTRCFRRTLGTTPGVYAATGSPSRSIETA